MAAPSSRTAAARIARPLPARAACRPPPRPRQQRAFSSVNPDEVSHFDALAGEWWDPHGSSRLLHLMNPLRHDFIRACLESDPQRAAPGPGARLAYLDIGCGGGIFAESAARLPTTGRVTGVDPTASVLAVARAHARRDPALRSKLTYRQGSVEQLEVPRRADDSYDVVSLFEVLEHVDEPAAFLARVRPLVRPGGWLVVSTIARTWTSWLTTKLVAEGVLCIVPRGTHDWAKYINEHELRRHLTDRGWQSSRVMGVVYVPGLGWREMPGSERVGNYFLGVRRGSE